MEETTNRATIEDHALIIASDSAIQQTIQLILEQAGWRVEVCHGRNEFRSMADASLWLLIIIVCGPDSGSLQDTLQDLQPLINNEQSFAVVIAEQPSINDAILCTRLGAMDYLAWPVSPGDLLEIAGRIRKLANYALSKNPVAFPLSETTAKSRNSERALVGGSAAMINLSKQLVRIARSDDLRVFITGETGTGKEVVARLIHEISGRSGPFLAVNCAATVENLLESDLFGHEKGAFTGASSTKRGLWEEAADGTLFLDEITETSPSVQAKLLRVLQEGVLRRVGSNREIKVTARVIAASNRDLEQAVKEEQFRQDLFYRLGQVLRLPPLRERLEDIPMLVNHFCQRASRQIVITPEAMEALCAYDWPGNVRELESVIQQIVTFSGSFVFREDVLRHIHIEQEEQRKANLPFWSAMKAFEKEEWPTIREFRKWYVSQAYLFFGKELVVARKLGIDVRTVSTILRGDSEQAPNAEMPQDDLL
ncbi:MAG: sigma 54-interacting transcriptional regulator [Blastocatellales bacterium]